MTSCGGGFLTQDGLPGTVIQSNTGTLPVGGAQTTVVPAPLAIRKREIKLMTVFNRDAVAATFTVLFKKGGTSFQMHQRLLNQGESLEWPNASVGPVHLQGTNETLEVSHTGGLTTAPDFTAHWVQ